MKVYRVLCADVSKWAIGDTHGCPKTLLKLLLKLKLTKLDKLYFLGDYINKGPDSKGMLDMLLDLKRSGYLVKFIKGNNEQKLLDAFDSSAERKDFEDKYVETLQSFGVSTVLDIPKKYIDFLRSMPLVIQTKNYILHHGDLEIVDYNKDKTVLEGHLPTKVKEIKSKLKKRKIVLDGGITKNKKGLGFLIAYNFRDRKIVKQRNIDF